MADARNTLLLALDRGLAPIPQAGQSILFLNAAILPEIGFRDLLDCEQGLRPDYLALKAAGYRVSPEIGQGGHDGALVMITRSRLRNEALLARAWTFVKPGGTILVVGDNHDGAKSLRKYVARHCGEPQSLSKHHAIAFAFTKNTPNSPFPASAWPKKSFQIEPGMFSADGPDEGSLLLARHFDMRIEGTVADFGAGWGYLGMALLSAAPGLTNLVSVEANHLSLRAAEINLSQYSQQCALSFEWLDITRERLPQDFDTIIMNPPFHSGRAANPQLGKSFIASASRSLKAGGRLLMVANRQLPYEAMLEENFKRHSVLEEDPRFKVIEAFKA